MTAEPSGVRAGVHLGPYEVVELLGRGARGEVWRAHDPRLGRSVAIKLLVGTRSSPEALRELAREARTASALSHPNIVTVHDVALDSEPPFLVLELVPGRTLASLLAAGALPVPRALDLAAQIATGLAAAHEAGLVHRDVKPANTLVTREGHAKILDFGLALLSAPAVSSPNDATIPGSAGTIPGVAVGTPAYMAPEQAEGHAVDFRADQFALGALLHELLTGRPAFARGSILDTLAAVVRDEPEPIPRLAETLDGPVRRILARCLAKDPDDRYAATRDLARDLRDLATLASSREPAATEASVPSRTFPRRTAMALVAGAAVALVAVGAGAGLLSRRPPLPSFRQLTFRRGTVWAARFTPGGEDVVYGASWDGSPAHLFSTRIAGGPSVPLGQGDASLLAVSPSGELLVSLGARPWLVNGSIGTAARMPLVAGAPRALLDGVAAADTIASSSDILAVTRKDGRTRLEVPGRRVLFETPGWISHVRAAPDGVFVAFLHHPVIPDDGGDVVLVPVSGGEPRVLSSAWMSLVGLSWTPSGEEVWFTATGETGSRTLRAVTRSGRVREVYRMPGNLTLHDVARSGLVLLSHDTTRIGAQMAEEGSGERDVSWLDATLLTDLSPDGRTLLFTEFGEGGGSRYSASLRPADGGPPVTLGSGFATALGPDGKKVLSFGPNASMGLGLVPTGTGPTTAVEMAPVVAPSWASFFAGGGSFLVAGADGSQGVRLWHVAAAGGPARAISPPGVDARFSAGAPSPDGKTVAVAMDDGDLLFCPVAGGEPRRLATSPRGLVPIAWLDDGRQLLAFARSGPGADVVRLDPSTGLSVPVRRLAPSDGAGVIGIPTVRVTPDGRTWAWSYARNLSELYVAEGLK
ncbi:MAG: serine/threonine-protein kinase [Holophagales bacterium]|nr:serine/threonine-protein kinase [Holophagales bacterium]